MTNAGAGGGATPPDLDPHGTALVRLTELLLFLMPFVAFAAWRLPLGSGPSRLALAGTACALLLLAAILLWLNQERASPPGTAYVPARLQDGRIVPGHAVPQ
jgi:hypothetical protein